MYIHLFRFFRSPNCTHCNAFKPFIFQMDLEFGETALTWQDREKTIELHEVLMNKERHISELELKYKMSQEAMQKLEVKLKKQTDALNGQNSALDDLKERICTQEHLNKYLQTQNEILVNNQAKSINENKKVEVDNENSPAHAAKNLDKKCETNGIGILKNLLSLTRAANAAKTSNIENDTENHKETISTPEENTMPKLVNFSSEINCQNKSISVETPDDLNKNELSPAVEQNPVQKGTEDENSTNCFKTVVIENVRLKDLAKWNVHEIVIYLARKMNLSLNTSDINNFSVIKKHNLKTATLIVTFEKIDVAQTFLDKKERLRMFPNTKFLKIN